MRSPMQHSFAQVPRAEIQRSSFDRSHGYKTVLNAGELIPIFVDEALPGDTFSLQTTAFARIATPIHPIMDNLFFSTFYFAVPIRLIWENWQRFNGEQDAPDDSTDFLIPQMVAPTGGYALGSLSDYFGIPTGVAGLSHSSLWHRAYNLIWREWFRDQNLQDPPHLDLDDGPDDPADYPIRRRGKRHDYFTSCLPWPQKGESVSIPLGATAPVVPFGAGGPTWSDAFNPTPSALFIATGGTTVHHGSTIAGGDAEIVWGDPKLAADLSSATAATINQLRQAFQIQRLYERDARGGSRYTEIVRSHFGVISPDARLQRPEYLGGSTSPVTIHTVPQTSNSETDVTPQGNLGAFGTALVSGGHGFSKSFTEHCILIGLISIRADLNYQTGLNRMFSRRSRFEFYWPALAHIGEQAVLNKEIFAQGTAVDDEVFGYQERFAEYRYKPSVVTNAMRSTAPQSLDTWHLAQDFASLPMLNEAFIEEHPPVDRIIAVPSEGHFILDCLHQLRCARPMPVFGVPGMIDHF